MLGLTLAPLRRGRLEVLCIGAHCDDIEIGCGGTVLSLQERYPRCRIHWLVLSSVPSRRRETTAAAKALIRASARGELRICDFPDGFLPARFAEVKAEFEAMRKGLEPDLVFTHHGLDRHQDHSLISQITWQTFRDHLIWEYEIPKYDGDLTTPGMYVPLASSTAARKVDVIMRAFVSQRTKSWFSAENLLAAMRIRGLECRAASGFAEAFHCRKVVTTFGAAAATARRRPSKAIGRVRRA
jgi:LmbE family N-acetylglucosaminyl deacetylase